jgi:hypothetical protein
MFAPDYSATFATTKMWTNSTWAFYVLLNFYGSITISLAPWKEWQQTDKMGRLGRIHNTLFTAQLTNGPYKLEHLILAGFSVPWSLLACMFLACVLLACRINRAFYEMSGCSHWNLIASYKFLVKCLVACAIYVCSHHDQCLGLIMSFLNLVSDLL